MKKLLMLLLVAVVVSALTACGGNKDSGNTGTEASSGAATGATVDLNIDATNFKFDQDEYRLKAGDVVNLNFTSSEGMHGLKIADLGVDLQDGQSTTFTAEKGEYVIECSVMCGTGHAEMISKLIVE